MEKHYQSISHRSKKINRIFETNPLLTGKKHSDKSEFADRFTNINCISTFCSQIYSKLRQFENVKHLLQLNYRRKYLLNNIFDMRENIKKYH